jgi:hypothetical protein
MQKYSIATFLFLVTVLWSPLSDAASFRIRPIGSTFCTMTEWYPQQSRRAPLRVKRQIKFPCSLIPSDDIGGVRIKNLSDGRVYGDGWATARSCIYKEGISSICTQAEWMLEVTIPNANSCPSGGVASVAGCTYTGHAFICGNNAEPATPPSGMRVGPVDSEGNRWCVSIQ